MREFHLHIDKGTTHTIFFKAFNNDDTPIDLSDYTPVLKFIEKNGDVITVDCEFTITQNEVYGVISAETTDEFTQTNYRYRLDMVKDPIVMRFLLGDVIIY